jgi:hypothetical protein
VRQCYTSGGVSPALCVAHRGVAADTAEWLHACSRHVDAPLNGLLWGDGTAAMTVLAGGKFGLSEIHGRAHI